MDQNIRYNYRLPMHAKPGLVPESQQVRVHSVGLSQDGTFLVLETLMLGIARRSSDRPYAMRL